MRHSISFFVSMVLLTAAAGCGNPCDSYCKVAVDRLISCKILEDTQETRKAEVDACLYAARQPGADTASCDSAAETFQSYSCNDLDVMFCGSSDPRVICKRPVECDDHNPCTMDTCDPDSLPMHTPSAQGTPCYAGVCDGAGACVQCLEDSACPPTGEEPCVVSACINHLCDKPAAPMGTPCDDKDPCTIGDTCANGLCGAGAPVVCKPVDDCHSAGVCQPSGKCTTPPLCSGSAVCQGGSCTAAACGAGLSFVASEGPEMNLLWLDDVVTGDVDGDGDLDLVMMNSPRNTGVSVIVNQGNGSYASGGGYELAPTSDGASSGVLLARDLDGDGLVDLAAAIFLTGKVVVLHNQGLGAFAAPVTYPLGDSFGGLDAADMDGDGRLDLVVRGPSFDQVTVLPNLGGGAFGPGQKYPAGTSYGGFALADLDGDGAVDVVVSNHASSTISVLHNQGGGKLAAPVDFPASAQPDRLAAGDLNGDGRPDLVTLSTSQWQAGVLMNNGNGTFAAPVSLPIAAGSSALLLADVDRDGDLDLFVPFGDEIQLFRNEGGSLTAMDKIWVKLQTSAVTAGDLDGNGYPDLVSVNESLSIVYTNCSP